MEKLKLGEVKTATVSRAFSDSFTTTVAPSNVYLITFSPKYKRGAESRGWNYTPELAPSATLFSQMQELKKRVEYDRAKVFNEFYKQRFIGSISNETSMSKLAKLLDTLKSGNDILIICYCGDERYCHRSIIKYILEESLRG